MDWLTPPRCLACEQLLADDAGLCTACWHALHFLDDPVCEALGTPFDYDPEEAALSPAAIADPPPWNRGRAAVAFDAASRHLVHLLKYQDRQEAGRVMARMMRSAGRKLLDECDVILPVPLHRRRLWQRRFNQAALLSGLLARASGKPWCHDVLLRKAATRSQVGLTAEERHKNVRRAFELPPDKRLQVDGKRVLLVDDVRTTGATLAACAVVLKAAGAAQVDVLSFALVLEPARLHIDA